MNDCIVISTVVFVRQIVQNVTEMLQEKKSLITLSNQAVHKSHREAKEDEVMQVIHLEEKNYLVHILKTHLGCTDLSSPVNLGILPIYH